MISAESESGADSTSPSSRARSAVLALLVLHTAVVWLAFVLRVDQFPLSWAPMYSTQGKSDSLQEAPQGIILQDKQWLSDHGWEGETRAGARESIPLERVNVPMRSMWRLYYERTFGKGAPKYSQQIANEPVFDEWLERVAPGLRFHPPDFARRLFESINKTLGREPDSPDFIVTIRAQRWRLMLDPEDFSESSRIQEAAELRFREEWREDWRAFGGLARGVDE